MSFYVTLPSDSSMQYFPENKISHFTTQLPTPFNLNGQYEVGLSEIIYPHSWQNINIFNNSFHYDIGDGKLIQKKVEVGCYDTMFEIIGAIQSLLPKNPSKFTLSYNKSTKKVKINVSQGSTLYLENLSEILGFPKHTIVKGNMKGEYVSDAWSTYSFFYIYSDIVVPQIVGHMQAPLVKIVKVKGNDGEIISQYYGRPQYVPLMRNSFQTIDIELRLNSGDFIPFQRGKVIVVLHFRPRQIL